jgi:hypothetical protein
MKKLIFCAFIVIIFVSCRQKVTVFESGTPEEKWDIMRDNYMVPGVPVSIERPLPNVLSEQEVLLRAIEYANKMGMFHPSYHEYEDQPELLTAKIETPVLIYNFTGYPSDDGGSYFFTAVADNGECLMDAYVRPVVDAGDDTFEISRSVRWGKIPAEQTKHYMSKREAVALIQEQFPGKGYTEPIAVRISLENKRHSNSCIFWYFEISDSNARGLISDEYIIDSLIGGYNTIVGGISNRRAISTGYGGSFYLDGARMAKLAEPLRLQERLENARSAGRSLGSLSETPIAPSRIIPVPLQ